MLYLLLGDIIDVVYIFNDQVTIFGFCRMAAGWLANCLIWIRVRLQFCLAISDLSHTVKNFSFPIF